MFIGEYSTIIGDKNRIAIPKKIRDEITGKVILTRGYERCLILFDTQRFESFVGEINKRPLLSMDARDTKRYILGGAQELEIDVQGRFVINEQLKAFANLESKIIFLGVGEWVEIWNEDSWLNKLNNLTMNVSDIADRIL